MLRSSNYLSAVSSPVRIWTFHPTGNINKVDDWVELHEPEGIYNETLLMDKYLNEDPKLSSE